MPTPSTSPQTPAYLKKYRKCMSSKSIKNKEKLITKLETQIHSIKHKNHTKTQKLREKITKDRERFSKLIKEMEDKCKKIKEQEETQTDKIYERLEKLVEKIDDEKEKCDKYLNRK